MVVYADILIITNFIVDYFLLRLTAAIIKRQPRLLRYILASLAASLSTLIIFLPEQGRFLGILMRLAISVIICLICFGFESARRLTLASLTFFAVTFCYAGGMLAVWYIFKPYGMAINNSVVYFDVSPVFLISFSVAGFVIFSLVSSVFGRRNKSADICDVTLCFSGKTESFRAVIDSGNSLRDPFSDRAVIITDGKKCLRAFGELSAQKYPDRYRAVPCSTVSGALILDGFRCDCGRITTDKKTVSLSSPLMAISKTPLCDCEAIVNPLDID